MAIDFDLAGFRRATDKGAWYREQGWKHLETAVAMRKMDAQLADECRRTAEAMFKRADEISSVRHVVAGAVVTDGGELPAGLAG